MKAIKIVAAVVAVFVIGIAVVLMTLDVSQYKGVIEAQAKSATGREVTIGGINLAISLAPAIVLTDVKVANASWGSRPEMAILPRLEVHTQLVPLLFGTINLTEIIAENPDIFLEINKQGTGNWEFDAASDSSSTPLNVGDVSINGLKLAYRDAGAGRSMDVAVKAIAVTINGALQDMNITSVETRDATVAYKATGAPMSVAVETLTLDRDGRIDLSGEFAGDDLKVRGTLAPISALIAMDKAFPVKIDVDARGVSAGADLIFEMVKGRPTANGKISISEINMSKIASGATAPADGRLFSAEPLPWDAIAGTDVDLVVAIVKVTPASGVAVTEISLPLKSSGGRLRASPIAFAIAGGTIGGDGALNAGDKSVSLKLSSNGFTAEGLAKALKQVDLIAQGPVDLRVDVRGAGHRCAT